MQNTKYCGHGIKLKIRLLLPKNKNIKLNIK